MKKSLLLISCILLAWLSVAWSHGQPLSIRILYFNDFHGFAEPHRPLGSTEKLGGIAHLAGRVNSLRQEKPSLLLAAGDMIQGNNWANLFQGKSVIELMNAMGVDAMVVGNHEFDFGLEVAKKRFSEAAFPVLGANVEGLPALKPYVIKEIQGIKVALIGVVTEETPASTHPRNVAGLKFVSPESAIEKYLPELRKEANVVIVLSHLGHPADRLLAEKVAGIDVIVGGHSHTKMVRPLRLGNTIIVQAWEHAKALGVLDLTLEHGKIVRFDGRLEEIKPVGGKTDRKVGKIVATYSRQTKALLNTAVGQTEVDLDGEHVRLRETNLGDWLADIMREASGADATIINGGSIRASIFKGGIAAKDIYAALPFDSYLMAIRLTGGQIKDALEHGVSGLEQQAGRFPQISGLSFTYRASAPVGSRVQDVFIDHQPLVLDKKYLVATNDFLAAGGDGYRVFVEALRASGDYSDLGGALKSKSLVYSDPGTWLRDLAIKYLKERKTIAPRVEGRIKEIG